MALYSADVLFWTLAVLGVILTGISKSGFAGGAGVVAVPILSLYIPVGHAVTLMLPLLLVMDAKTLHYYWKSIRLRELKAIVPASLVGLVVGVFLLGSLNESFLLMTLGTISLTFALWQKLAPLLGRMRGAAWLWGGIGGLTSTLIHAGGPPLNIYLIARQLPKEQWLATAGVFFGVLNIVKVIPYSLVVTWSSDIILTSLVLVPVALLGSWLGRGIQTRIDEKTFMGICRGLLFCSGCGLIYKALI